MKNFINIFLLAAAIFALQSALFGQTTFSNNTGIVIGDGSAAAPGTGAPYPSSIIVSGLAGTVTDVNVRVQGLSHTFPDDVGLLLVSPGGTKYMVIQSDVGGGTDAVNVTYTFDDQAAAGIPNAGPLVAGTYQTSSVGDDDMFPIQGANPPPSDCFNTACPQASPAGSATLNGTFGGINPNGEWRLYAVDCCAQDTGTITGGWSIIVTTNSTPVPKDAPADFNGDGKTDFSVVRPDGFNAGHLVWFTKLNNAAGTVTATEFGLDSDFITPGDFDGDGKDDIAIWRQGGPIGNNDTSGFYVLRSSDSTYTYTRFGQAGDDVSVVADYTGDGKDDFAIYRPGATVASGSTPNQSAFWYLASSGQYAGKQVMIAWGVGANNAAGDNYDRAYPGDFNGDGVADFCVYRAIGNQAMFITAYGNGNGGAAPTGVNQFFGVKSDDFYPGDYDGDGKTDLATARVEGSNLVWIYKPSSGGSFVAAYWGVAGDYPVQGDYDGDGKTDLAVWRPSGNPGAGSWFYALGSLGGTITSVWGAPGDAPVANDLH